MAQYWQRMQAFSPSLRRLFVAAICMLFVWSGLMGVLYNLYLLRLGFDARTVGLLGGLGALVWGLAALPAGLLSTRLGLRNSLQIGGLLYGLGLALALLVEWLPRPLWGTWLIASGTVMNIGIAFAMVNATPYMMAVTGEYERPHAFAIMAALGPLAAFGGSLVGGLLPGLWAHLLGVGLDQPLPYRLALAVGPLVSWLGMIPMLRADPGLIITPDSGGEAGVGSQTSRAPLALLSFWACVVFLEALGEGTVRMFFNVFLDTGLQVAIPTIGLVMGSAQLLPIAAALALPLLLARWGTGQTLFGALLALGVCLMPLALGAQLGARAGEGTGWHLAVWLVSAVYLAVAATTTILGTARDMFGQELVIPRWGATSQGAAMVGLAFGLSAAGVGGGLLIAARGFGALYLAGALAVLTAAALLLGLLGRRPRAKPVGPAVGATNA